MATQGKTLILTVVRHGQTDANIQRIVHGWTDTPLNATGLNQAQAAGKALKEIKFHQAFSSDLQRANKTCQLILEENQVSNISPENINQDKLLRERNFGIFEGDSYDLKLEDRKEDFAPENGESGIDVKSRANQFLKSLGKLCEINESIPSILIVSHGGLIRRMLSIIFEELNCSVSANVTNVPDFKESKNARRYLKNTCFSRFEVDISNENFAIKAIRCLELCNADHLET